MTYYDTRNLRCRTTALWCLGTLLLLTQDALASYETEVHRQRTVVLYQASWSGLGRDGPVGLFAHPRGGRVVASSVLMRPSVHASPASPVRCVVARCVKHGAETSHLLGISSLRSN